MSDQPSNPIRVVFVPGLGANGGAYQPLVRALGKEFDVRSAEVPLDFPEELTWEFFEAAIDRAAGDWLGFVLAGHSLGGAVALHYAAGHADRVTRTVVVAPVLFPFVREHRPWRRIRSLMLGLRNRHLLHFLKVARVRKLLIGEGRARKLYHFAGRIDVRDSLPKLQNAVILYPEHEEIIPRPHLEQVRQQYPNVQTRVVPGSHNDLALGPRRLVAIMRKELSG